MTEKQPITAPALRRLADALQDEGQRISDYLEGTGMTAAEVSEGRRRHVTPRYAAAGALRNAAQKLAAIVATSIGEV